MPEDRGHGGKSTPSFVSLAKVVRPAVLLKCALRLPRWAFDFQPATPGLQGRLENRLLEALSCSVALSALGPVPRLLWSAEGFQ